MKSVTISRKATSAGVGGPAASRLPVVSKLTFDAAATIPAPELVTQRGRRHFAPRLPPTWLQRRSKDNGDSAARDPAAGTAAAAAAAAAVAHTARILDGFMLLDACGVEFPDEASRADVQEEGLSDAITEDLSYFTNLVYLN
eukprot:g2016.t1